MNIGACLALMVGGGELLFFITLIVWFGHGWGRRNAAPVPKAQLTFLKASAGTFLAGMAFIQFAEFALSALDSFFVATVLFVTAVAELITIFYAPYKWGQHIAWCKLEKRETSHVLTKAESDYAP
jgi:hypothetical protein